MAELISVSLTYDANDNLASKTDWNSNKTTFVYDLSRNLETRKVEAAGTTLARTTQTEWHPDFRLPARIAEPKRLTSYVYDATGNVLTATIQATTDSNGVAGFTAAPVGAPRRWTRTYDSLGQVLTVTGPRTDVNDTTTYSYDEAGNLATITNAKGHLTTLSGYDANGRVGSIVDPNGEKTTLSYTPRGWLSARTEIANGNSATTSFTYDGVGQLTMATFPDSSSITYVFDDAHRLTRVSDSLGNSINYTLDNMGNRTSELMNDAAGGLARKTSRVYDALNRLQQQTGTAQ